MKNKILTLLAVTLLATSCGKKENSNEGEKVEAKVICPTGAPAVAFYNHFEDKNFETNSVPSNIVSFMNESSPYDIVVIDTTSGIRAINNGAPFKIHSTITFGNFFIASTGHDNDGVMNEGDKIVLFGKNQTPDLLFHYIYGDALDSSIEYVTAVSDAAGCLASGKNVSTGSDVDYVFVAQPVLFATLNNKNAPTYGKSGVYANIQEKYKEKSGDKSLVQASAFVKNNTKADYESYLDSLKEDIEAATTTPDVVTSTLGKFDEDAVKTKYGIAPAAMKATLASSNSLGLGFKKASNNKDDINNFISIFGLGEITDEIIA